MACALELNPDEIIKNILNGVRYECDMCNSIVYCLTRYKPNSATYDVDHSKKFHNNNIRKLCDFLKLKDELKQNGILPKYKCGWRLLSRASPS
jgi:hypothetical protein